jgi:hypothetical protein
VVYWVYVATWLVWYAIYGAAREGERERERERAHDEIKVTKFIHL